MVFSMEKRQYALKLHLKSDTLKALQRYPSEWSLYFYWPLCHCAGDDGGGGGCERQLEQEGGVHWAHVFRAGVGVDQEVAHAHEREFDVAAAEAEAEAERPVGQPTEYHVHNVFHHDVDFVFYWDAARFQQTKSYNKKVFF